jgi:hypothetical protein
VRLYIHGPVKPSSCGVYVKCQLYCNIALRTSFFKIKIPSAVVRVVSIKMGPVFFKTISQILRQRDGLKMLAVQYEHHKNTVCELKIDKAKG